MATKSNSSAVLTVPDFAKAVGRCEETVRRHCRQGKYKGAYQFGHQWFSPRSCMPMHAQIDCGGVDPTGDVLGDL